MEASTSTEHPFSHVSSACHVLKAVPDQGVPDISLTRVWGPGDLQSEGILQATALQEIRDLNLRRKNICTSIWLKLFRFQQRGCPAAVLRVAKYPQSFSGELGQKHMASSGS